MSETESTTAATTDAQNEITNIGVEFEFPVAANPEQVPIGGADRSDDFHHNTSNSEVPDDGQMTSDHIGAEVITGIKNPHEDRVKEWYREVIELAEDKGYTFAECAQGETNFGLHLHLSEMSDEEVTAIREMCQEPWMYVFCCASVTYDSADPFRYGSYTARPQRRERGIIRSAGRRDESNHYEWRFPEPCNPEQFDLIIEFIRILDSAGTEAARQFAIERVLDRDERLTPIRQYKALQEERNNWPDQDALSEGSATVPVVAEFMRDLMEGNEIEIADEI